MTVQEKIASVATRFKEAEYRFMNWAMLNVELDHVEKPTICYILPASGTLTPKRSATLWRDAPQTQIAFLVPTDFDFDGAENDDLIETMKDLAKQFVRALNASGHFEMIDDQELPYRVAYDTLDDNVTGIILDITLKEKEMKSYCNNNYNFGFE